MNARKLANGLGWFSIGLGLMELIGAEKLAPRIGLAHVAAVTAADIACGAMLT
jgi:hypothetical protein